VLVGGRGLFSEYGIPSGQGAGKGVELSKNEGNRSLGSCLVRGQLLSRGVGGAKLSRKRRSNSMAVRTRCVPRWR